MNIQKRDVLELRRRLTKKACSIDRISGCYVGGSGEVLLRFTQSFTDLEDEDLFKYLEIAKKVLSGNLGGNLLELEFDRTDSATERQQFLLALRADKMKNEELLDRFYEQVMQQYQQPGNYIILVFHDIYDVITRTSDRAKLDESEEVYEYMICAICPVELSKAGLGYREEENRIATRERDWVVSAPEIGFLYPAFSSRSSDVNAVMYYVKNGADSCPELVENVLGCKPQHTGAEQKKIFKAIVEEAFGSDIEQAENAYLTIQRNLDGLVSLQEDTQEQDVSLDQAAIADVMADVEMADNVRQEMEKRIEETFADRLPMAKNLLDSKLAAEGVKRAQTKQLQQKIQSLEEALEQKKQETDEGDRSAENTVAVNLSEARAARLKVQTVDGQEYLMIPVDSSQVLRVNGVERVL